MANKYVSVNAGQLAEVEGLVTSAGAGDSGKIPALGVDGRISQTMMPVGVGPDTKSLVASETLSAGDLINVWDDGGTPKMRKADASNSRRADGFVLEGVTSAATGLAYFEGVITGLSGLTIGAPYYLSGSTPGAATATPVSTTGYISQDIGKAVSATEITFEPQRVITLA